MRINEIEFLRQGRTKYYTKPDAIKLLSVLAEKRCKLLGIDGFFITESTTQPSLEHSINFSSGPHKVEDYTSAETYSMAKEYLEKIPDGMYFELVHSKDPDMKEIVLKIQEDNLISSLNSFIEILKVNKVTKANLTFSWNKQTKAVFYEENLAVSEILNKLIKRIKDKIFKPGLDDMFIENKDFELQLYADNLYIKSFNIELIDDLKMKLAAKGFKVQETQDD